MKFELFTAIAAFSISSPAVSQVTHNDWFPGTSSISEVEMIPPGYRGKWAPNLANCSDQDGVEHMHIYPNGIDFYESGGRLERITQAGQERSVLMKLSFEGEGGFWDRVWKVTLSADGKRLTIALQDGSSAENYVRCPQNWFVSGTMGLRPDFSAPDTLEEQLECVWNNLRAILASAGMTVDNIVRLTSHLRDASYAEANAQARIAALGNRRIPTTAIVAQTLDPDWLIELEVIAAA